ncbi:MAG: hypothetical protein P1V33_03435 [Pseudohongiella nitratireducens]|nr:hypothetical protein [Pseudohongiella nitratireducens]MDF1622507.1 hypothetical protein [Pseudohongiella nitratireducens]
MSGITVHAGPFEKGPAKLKENRLLFREEGKYLWQPVPLSNIEFQVATEENVKKVAGTVGWGAAGAVLLGPAGLLAGLLLGGRKKEVTFIGLIQDGRKFLATTDSKTYTKLQAGSF